MSEFIRLVGFRYALSAKQSPILSFISRLSMASLVTLLITVLSVMNGFDKALREDILSIVPHISLSKASAVDNWQVMKSDLEQEDGVESVQGFSAAFGMLNYLASVKPVMIYGVDVTNPQAIKMYQSFTSVLDWASLRASNGIILASALAKQLKVKQGETLRLLISDDVNEQVKTIPVKIVALIHTGTELDQKLAIADLGFLSKVKGFPHR